MYKMLALIFIFEVIGVVKAGTPTSMDLIANATGTNNGGKFCPSLDDGVNITCIVDHGDVDGTGQMWTESDHSTQACVTYSYSSAGYRTIHLYCAVDNIYFHDVKTIYVGENIESLKVGDQNGGSFIPMINQAMLYVSYENGSDVYIEVLSNTTQKTVQAKNATSQNESFLTTPSDFGNVTGQHAVRVTVSNPLTTLTRWVIVVLEEEILGYESLETISSIMHYGDQINLTFTLTSGSDVSVTTIIQNTTIIDKCNGQLRNYSFTYILNETGSYTIERSISNFVSNENQTFPITVQYPVNNITIQRVENKMKGESDTLFFNMSADALYPMGTLYAIIEIENNPGISTNLSLSSLTPGASEPHTITYNTAGYFQVNVTIHSETSQFSYTWTQIIENEINLELVCLERVPTSEARQQIGVKITNTNTSPLYKLNCTFNIDGMSVKKNFEQVVFGTNETIEHQYSGTGNKSVNVNCSNTLREWTESVLVEVWTDCFSSAEFFSSDFKCSKSPMKVYITDVVQITAKLDVADLCKNSSRTYWWDFYDVDHSDSSLDLRSYYNDTRNQPHGITITFAKEAIEAGIKMLMFKVNLTDVEGGELQDFIYVEFITPPVMASIKGGTRVTVEKSNGVVLNATQSKDPVQLYSSQPFTFSWQCFNVSISDESLLDRAIVEFQNDSDSFSWTDCGISLQKKGEIQISSTQLVVDRIYVFVVTIGKENMTQGGLLVNRTDRALQAVKIVNYPLPNAEIKCIRNCMDKASKGVAISLEITCKNCDDSTTYLWDVLKYDGSTFNSVLGGNGMEQYVETRTNTLRTLAVKTINMNAEENFKITNNVTLNGKSATFSYYVVINKEPRGGTCTAYPETGDASLTFFEIRCKNWLDEGPRSKLNDDRDKNEALVYKFIQRRTLPKLSEAVDSLLGETVEPLIKAYLSIGDPDKDYNSTIIVRITDKYNGYAEVSLPVKVQNSIKANLPLDAQTPTTEDADQLFEKIQQEISKTNSLETLMTTSVSLMSVLSDFEIVKNDSYPNVEVNAMPSGWQGGLLDAKLVNGSVVMEKFDDMLNDILQRSLNSYQQNVQNKLKNMTQQMLDALQLSNTTTFAWIETSANAFSNILVKEDYVSEDSVINAADALNHLTESFTNLTAKEGGAEHWFTSGSISIENSQSSIYQLIDILVENTTPENLSNDSDAVLASSNTASSRSYVEYLAETNRDKAYEYSENSTITPEERVGLYFMRSRIAELKYAQKRQTSETSGKAIDEALNSITKAILDIDCYGCHRLHKKNNLVVYTQKDSASGITENSTELKSTSLSLNFGLTDDNQAILFSASLIQRNIYLYDSRSSSVGALISSPVLKLTSTDTSGNPVSINTANVVQPVVQPQAQKVTIPRYIPDDASKLFYHSFMYRHTGDYACFHVKQELPVLNEKYTVYLRQGQYPDILTYDASTVVDKNRDYMSCIPPESFTRTGIVYIGLKATPIPSFGNFTYNNINYTDPTLNPYVIDIISSGCETWNEKKENWNENSCQMDWFPSKAQIECKCSSVKGQTFGNTFYVPPNTIDFSTVFLKFSPEDQAAVLATFILFLVVYVALMIWGRHQDKKDIVKWGVTPLIDNFVDDTYYYLITVYTGMRRGAGTRSKVGIIVAGEDYDTGVRELFDGVRMEFSTASVQHFLMATSHPLGELTYIYVFHDNSGEGEWSSWYLNRIDIEDLQDRTRYVFLCGRWLSLDDTESRVNAVLPVCGKENVTTFQNMFFMNYKENLADNHLWVSIYFRPTCSHFTRIQRITCLLLFIMLTMVSNALFFRPEDTYENPAMVKVGPLQFSWRTVYVSVVSTLISTPGTILVALMFRKARPRKLHHDMKDSSLKYSVRMIDNVMDKLLAESKELERTLVAKGLMSNDGTILPFWMAYIAWFLAIAGSVTSAFFVMLFSMEWGKTKTEMWMAQFFLSFFESICIVDPLKVVFMAASFALIFSQLERFKPSGLKREVILRNYRQRYGQESSIRIPAPPLDDTVLEKARHDRMREIKMMTSVREVVITCVYLWIVFSISYSNRDTGSYALHRDIANRILTPSGKGIIQFKQVTTTDKYIMWLTQTAFPTLYPELQYNGERLHWRHRQYIDGLDNFRVGPPRIRQLRVVPGETTIPPFGKEKVYPAYNILDEDVRSFCFGWKNPPCDLTKEAYSFSYRAWKFTNSRDIWGVPVMGYYTSYSGGGYIAELDVNWDFSNRTLTELKDDLWFDRSTRAVFFEFTVYNADFNLFAYCTLVAEFPEVGGVMTMYSIYPFRIYQHLGPTGYYVIFCEVCFILFLLFMMGRVIYNLHKHRLAFFRRTWFILDLVAIFLSVVSIVMYFGRLILANQTLSKFKEDPKAFVNFQHIAYWDFLLIIVIGCLVFLGTIRLLGILGYDKRIGQVFRVFDNCAWDLIWFGIMFLIIFVFYAILGFLLFGRDLESYFTIFETLGTLFISMIGKSKFNEINDADPIMAQLYFFTYVLFIVYFLLTMFLAILCESINVVHQKTKTDRSDELIIFLMDKCKDIFFTNRGKNGKKGQEFTGIVAESQKPFLLLQELRQEIDSAMSKHKDDEVTEKQEMMRKKNKEFLKKLSY